MVCAGSWSGTFKIEAVAAHPAGAKRQIFEASHTFSAPGRTAMMEKDLHPDLIPEMHWIDVLLSGKVALRAPLLIFDVGAEAG